jgi:hypothetical protein
MVRELAEHVGHRHSQASDAGLSGRNGRIDGDSLDFHPGKLQSQSHAAKINLRLQFEGAMKPGPLLALALSLTAVFPSTAAKDS